MLQKSTTLFFKNLCMLNIFAVYLHYNLKHITMKKQRLMINITPDTRKKLEELKEKTGRSFGVEIEIAITMRHFELMDLQEKYNDKRNNE